MRPGLAERAPLAAALLAAATHLPSLWGRFLYDDLHVVVHNRAIRDLGALGTVLGYDPARPLLGLTWALNYAVAGATAWPYHLVNVLIHAANAALAASLFLWMSRRSGRAEPAPPALLAGALFAVTPMAVETVGYVASRSTALAALFVLASLRVAVEALSGGHRRRLAAALFLFVLGLLTKEEAAALPLLLLLLDYFFVAGRSARDVLRRHRLHLPFLLLPALGLLARRAATGSWLPAPALDLSRYLATQLAAFPLYALRTLVPIDPAFYRGHPAAPLPPDAATLVGWFVAAFLLGGAWLLRRRRPEWSLAVLWLAAGLLPSSSLVALKEMVVDHRAYLGGAGMLWALGGLLWRPGRTAFALVLVGLLAARSIAYQLVLNDPARAWQDAVRRAPASLEAYLALGDAYAAAGDPRAEKALRQAAALNPEDLRVWTNLGAYYVETGRLQGAEAVLRRASRLAPEDARVRDNLGLLLERLGRTDEAIAEYEAARVGRPALAQPRIRLAAILLRRGERELAARLLDEAAALEIDAEDARAIEELRSKLS